MIADIPAELQAALASRYQIRRVLGRGGMATVYLALDLKHHREVALKVLLPALAEFLGVERFLKEIEIAARLTHPHILPLHDSGEIEGFLYYVMPFADGGSLRERLGDGGRLRLEQALALATPVADALDYAHRMGVLHRDIKPENILFSQGHPVVADFGIARAVTSAGGVNLTRTGFPVGTPGYMSPEQAAGLTELDRKTDVYSLGVVIYEMLIGELPGLWPSEGAVHAGRFLEATPRAKVRLAEVGAAVESALVRALATRNDQRTATPGDLLQDLTGQSASPRRRYSADEVQEIVKRASELEVTTPTETGALTIGGVEALAAEVGITPTAVRAAVGSVRPSNSPLATRQGGLNDNRLIGGPTRIAFERIVEGELPEAEYPTLVDEIRRVFQSAGQVSQLGRSFTWAESRSQGGIRRDHEVIVTVRGGQTRITVHENLAQLIAATFGAIGGGMGGGGMAIVMGIASGVFHLAGAALPLLMPVWAGITLLTARRVYRNSLRKRLAELEELVDTLAELTKEIVAQATAPRLKPPLRVS